MAAGTPTRTGFPVYGQFGNLYLESYQFQFRLSRLIDFSLEEEWDAWK